MINLTEAQLARLPRKAQDELLRLDREAADWKAKATAGPEDSDTSVVHGVRDDNTPLGKGVRVQFDMPASDAGWGDWIEARLTKDGLEIMASGPVAITPHVTNHITIKPVRR